MTLIFERDIHLDTGNDSNFIWATDKNGRFRLVIPRKVLVDRYGLKEYFDHERAKEIIEENRADFEQAAQATRRAGNCEHIAY